MGGWGTLICDTCRQLLIYKSLTAFIFHLLSLTMGLAKGLHIPSEQELCPAQGGFPRTWHNALA